MSGDRTSFRRADALRVTRSRCLRALAAAAALAALAVLGAVVRSRVAAGDERRHARPVPDPGPTPVPTRGAPGRAEQPVGRPARRPGSEGTARFEAAEVLAIVSAFNAPEVARRVDCWNYLRERGRTGGETLDEHVRRYARVIDTGETAPDGEIAALEAFVERPLPADLRAFYGTVGQLRAGGTPAQVESVRRSLARLRLPKTGRTPTLAWNRPGSSARYARHGKSRRFPATARGKSARTTAWRRGPMVSPLAGALPP